MAHPIHLYLDSSDYSVLSDPDRREELAPGLLDTLRRRITDGSVKCFFSGILLSEMAPTGCRYTDASQRRADLLVELCGNNAFISLDRIIAGELQYALGQSDSLPNVYSQNAEWYPDGVAEISPIHEVDIANNVLETFKELGLSRQARRAAGRFALKKGRPRSRLKSALVETARSGGLEEILEKYPMRPEDARVFARYTVGDVSAEDASYAFLNSLKDPRWMMQWFEQHHEKLSPFIKWTRGPATTMLESMNEMAQKAAAIRARDQELGGTSADVLFSAEKWSRWQDELLEQIARRMSEVLLQQDAAQLQAPIIDAHCPCLSVGIRAIHSAWRSATQRTPRKPKPSDFPDGLHACYAPYADIFRADSFMAPHIENVTEQYGTTVVQKLNTLGKTLESLIDRREGASASG